MKRIKLKDRVLPRYSAGEEIMNMVTHIVGGGMGALGLLVCLYQVLGSGDPFAIAGALIYGCSLIALYTVSSVYHGLKPSMGKKVLQIIDHCTIYLLIAGTYTPVALCLFRPAVPVLGWGMLAFQWVLAAVAVTLTAIDLKRYNVFSMICYIGMGWAVLPFLGLTRNLLGQMGFLLLLLGGIAYTVGAVLYGIGSKKPWFHSVFHIFVVLGSVLQLLCVAFYVL